MNYLKQYQSMLRNAERKYKSSILNALFENAKTHNTKALIAALNALYKNVVAIQTHRTLLSIKERRPTQHNAYVDKLMAEHFNVRILNVANKISQTTFNIIQKGLQEGKTIDQITQEIISDGYTVTRARLIARTEASIAANTSSMLAAESTGLELKKIWLATDDTRTRGYNPKDFYDHFHMNGKEIEFGDLFWIRGEYLLHPGDATNGATAGNICNCRCTCLFIPKQK